MLQNVKMYVNNYCKNDHRDQKSPCICQLRRTTIDFASNLLRCKFSKLSEREIRCKVDEILRKIKNYLYNNNKLKLNEDECAIKDKFLELLNDNNQPETIKTKSGNKGQEKKSVSMNGKRRRSLIPVSKHRLTLNRRKEGNLFEFDGKTSNLDIQQRNNTSQAIYKEQSENNDGALLNEVFLEKKEVFARKDYSNWRQRHYSESDIDVAILLANLQSIIIQNDSNVEECDVNVWQYRESKEQHCDDVEMIYDTIDAEYSSGDYIVCYNKKNETDVEDLRGLFENMAIVDL